MAAQGRTETAPVGPGEFGEVLRRDVSSFDFGQAVRLLRRLYPDREGVGAFALPSREVARFSSNTSLAFPAGEVQDADLDLDGPARVEVNFMGLVGNAGVLPLHYSRIVRAQEQQGHWAFRDFLDLFQHRLVSLYYRAWEKTRFFIPFERGERDPLSERLLEMLGLGSERLRSRMDIPDRDLLFYAGLLGIQQRSAASLQRVLEDYFEVPVEVIQFVGGWYSLDRSSLFELNDEVDGDFPGLGEQTVVGDEIWDPQARVRIRMGPLARDRYEAFLPGGTAHRSLKAFTDFFGGGDMDFEVQLVLAREDVPPVRLGAEEDASTPLGWCTWIQTRPFDRDADETTLTL